MGCNGGWLGNVWKYLARQGAATDSCIPYGSYSGVSPQCTTTCANASEKYIKYKAVAANSCQEADHTAQVNCIKNEIYYGGPVETGFTVYNDFFSYSSGVY
jgi:cathepsin B